MKAIVAIDQTASWKKIVEEVGKRRWPRDTSFRILTVLPPNNWKQFESPKSTEILREIFKMRRKAAENILREAREILSSKVVDCIVHTDLRQGSPRIEILDAAVDWMADKIILGAHGRSPNRLFPGSVSRSVAEHAQCSVELVPLKACDNAETHANSGHANTV